VAAASRFLPRTRNLPKVANEGGPRYEAHEAGDSAFNKGFARLRIPLGIVFVALIAAGFAFGKGGEVGFVIDGAIALALLSAVFIDRVYRSESWLKGWFGEMVVAHVLSNLPEPFAVLHDITVNGKKWNIDHVVIGPTGVWLIETKNWSGEFSLSNRRLTVDGYDQSGKVNHTVANAVTLRKHLQDQGIPVSSVNAVFVSVQSSVPDGKMTLTHITVIGSSDLVPYIRSGKQILSPAVVRSVVAVIEGVS
jgi:Nuclease-related domain